MINGSNGNGHAGNGQGDFNDALSERPPDGWDLNDARVERESREFDELRGVRKPPPPRRVSKPKGTPHPFEPWDAGEWDWAPIEPRGWLLGNQFCRGFVSSLVSQGAGAKTTVRLAQLISLATGRELTGEHVFQRCRVLLICLDDNKQEMRRRIRAVLQHYNIDREELRGWLYIFTPDWRFSLARYSGTREIDIEPVEHQIRFFVQQYGIDLVAFDPFKKLANVDENDNSAIDVVATILSRLAIDLDIAVDTTVHERKGAGEPGDPNRGRGASSRRDAGRLEYTLTTMSPEEATQFGIPANERKLYVRLDSAKVNIAPASAEQWFELVPVPLKNGNDVYPRGDTVPTIKVWTPPDMWASITTTVANEILDTIATGLADGRRYSAAPNAGSDRAAWRIVQDRVSSLSEAQARLIVRTWAENDVLKTEPYLNPVKRQNENGLFVNDLRRPG